MYGGVGEEEKAQSFIPEVEEIIFSYIYASTPVQLKTESLYQFSMDIITNGLVNSTSQASYFNAMVEYANKGCLKGLNFLNDRYRKPIDDNERHMLMSYAICAMHMAIENGHFHIVNFLYRLDDKLYGVYTSKYVSHPAWERTPAKKGYLNIYKLFLDNNRMDYSFDLITPILEGYVAIAEHVLKSKKINSRNLPKIVGRPEMLELFLRYMNKNDYKTLDQMNEMKENNYEDLTQAINFAVQLGYLESLKILISQTRNVTDLLLNKERKVGRYFLIDTAAYCGYLEIVKVLLDSRFHNSCSSLAIQDAAEKGYLEIVKVLMEHKKPYNANEIKSQFPEITKYIKENGYNS